MAGKSITEQMANTIAKSQRSDGYTGRNELEIDMAEAINLSSPPIFVTASEAIIRILAHFDGQDPNDLFDNAWDTGEELENATQQIEDASYDKAALDRLLEADNIDLTEAREIRRTPNTQNADAYTAAVKNLEQVKQHHIKRNSIKRLFYDHLAHARMHPTAAQNVLMIAETDPAKPLENIRVSTLSAAKWALRQAGVSIPEWHQGTTIRPTAFSGPVFDVITNLYEQHYISAGYIPPNESMIAEIKSIKSESAEQSVKSFFSDKSTDVILKLLRLCAEDLGLKERAAKK